MSHSLSHEINSLQIYAGNLLIDIVIQLILAMRVLGVHQQAGNIDAGVIHQHIQLAESLLGLLDHVRDVIRAGDIGHHIEHLTAALVEVKLRSLGIHIANHHIGAVIQKSLSHCLADAGCAARNNCCLSL